MATCFPNFLSRRATICILPMITITIMITHIKPCFEARTILRAFNARLGVVDTFFMFIKTRKF